MKSQSLMIRYFGTRVRRFCVQRGDGMFWSGDGWTCAFHDALIFAAHKDAQATCRAIQRRRHKGKPVRRFKCEVTITVVGNDVAKLGPGDVAHFLARAVRLDVETEQFGDGPLPNTYLEARLIPATVQEKRCRKSP